jgi:hypothetical protein
VGYSMSVLDSSGANVLWQSLIVMKFDKLIGYGKT